MNKLTTIVYTLECYHNGESADFFRGFKVNAAPGHRHHEEFGALQDAIDALKKLKEDFFLRDGGEYEEIIAAAGEDAAAIAVAEEKASKALAEFVESGRIDDDGNYYGIRAFEVFAIDESGLAYILANNEDPQFTEAVAALERFGIDIEITDESEITDDDDPRAAAAEKNEEELHTLITNARRFVEVC